MVQIVNQEGLGELVGSSLGQALEQLAANKIKKYQESQTAGALSNLLKISPEQAMGLTKLGPHAQNSFIKQLMSKSNDDQLISSLNQSLGSQDINSQEQPEIRAPQAVNLPDMMPRQAQPESTALNNNANTLASIAKPEQIKPAEAIQPKVAQKKNVDELATKIAKKVVPTIKSQELQKKLAPQISKLNQVAKKEQPNKSQQANLVKEAIRQSVAGKTPKAQRAFIQKLQEGSITPQSLVKPKEAKVTQADKKAKESAQKGLDIINKLLDINSKADTGIFGYFPNKEAEKFDDLLNKLPIDAKNSKELQRKIKALPKLTQDPKLREEALKELKDDYLKILKKAGQDISNESKPQEAAKEQTKTAAEEPLNFMDQYSYLAGKAVQGLGEGVTGLAAAPFNIANLVSGGKIPVPEAIKSLEQLPAKATKALGYQQKAGNPEIETLGNFASDALSFLSPGGLLGGASKAANLVGKVSKFLDAAAKILKVSPKSAALTSAAGNAAHWLTKKVTNGNEKYATGAKLGTMLAVPIIGSRMASKELGKIAQRAKSAIPEGALINSPNQLKKNIDLYNTIDGLVSTPLKEKVLNQLEGLISPKQDVKKLFDLKSTLVEASKDAEFSRSLKNALPTFVEELDTTLNSATKGNTGFKNALNEYTELSNALRQSNKVYDFLKENISVQAKNPLVTSLLGIAGYSKPRLLAKIGIPALAAGEFERIAQMVLKSPAFRSRYEGVIKSALAGNVKEANKYVKQLDQIAQKE